MRNIVVSKNNSFGLESNPINVEPSTQYQLTIDTVGKKGEPYSGYFAVILLNADNIEIKRHIRWFTDFSGSSKSYRIVFSSTSDSSKVIVCYRINSETPVKSDFEIELQDMASLELRQTHDQSEDFDNIEKYEIPQLPFLNINDENILESKMTWIFSPPRSGTTWLGSQLLKHQDNIIWFEPWIGLHLGSIYQDRLSDTNPQFERIYDSQSNSGHYFFSPHHKKNWLPALRKFILARAYSEAQSLEKNLIIKEPVGSHAADIIMECFPNSKLIFLVRDGRDVVDSRIDMHGKNTWANLKPLTTPEQRKRMIRWYSNQWNKFIERINRAYTNHNPNLRLLVKYENLKNDTFSELKKIYNFLNIQVDDNELNKIINTYDFDKIPSSNKGKGKFYRSAKTGGWSKNFSQEEQEMMNSIMGDTLSQLEYDI